MTLLDDYEVRFKLQGVFVVQQMLQHVPKGLMKRTGIDGLIHSVCCVYPFCSNFEISVCSSPSEIRYLIFKIPKHHSYYETRYPHQYRLLSCPLLLATQEASHLQNVSTSYPLFWVKASYQEYGSTLKISQKLCWQLSIPSRSS